MPRLAIRGLTLTSLLLISGCLPFLKPAKAPIRTIQLPAQVPADCLAILLPGRFGGAKDFVKAGFRERVDEAGLALDLIAVDAHLGYYRTRSVVDRLREDVVGPARTKGYREVWIIGTSLGGVGALLYAREHPEDLTSVLAIAPFLGDKELLDEIQSQGGPKSWTPDPANQENFHLLWSWLRSRGDNALPLHLAFGTEDDFAYGGRMLASLLPEEHVLTLAGDHDWKVWTRIWEEFLASGTICSSASRGT